MLEITTSGGQLNIKARIPIPSAPNGHWSLERLLKLREMILQTVEAGEIVDGADYSTADFVKSPQAAYSRASLDSLVRRGVITQEQRSQLMHECQDGACRKYTPQ